MDLTGSPTSEVVPEELNYQSEHFDPMKFLYATDVHTTSRKLKVHFQNLAAFESAVQHLGIWKLCSKREDNKKKPEKKKDDNLEMKRNFEAGVSETTKCKLKHDKNLVKQIDKLEGPLALLRDCMKNEVKVRVCTRSKRGICTVITGYVISFDKHWNLLMKDVTENWKRRKYKYTDNKFCGTPSDCTSNLMRLGIKLPLTKVKSINRKYVEVTRSTKLLFIRGEHVVLINVASKTTDL